MKWELDLSSTAEQMRTNDTHSGGSVFRSTFGRHIFSGDAGLVLTAPTTPYKRATVNKWFPLADRVAIEIWFSMLDNSKPYTIEIAPEGFENGIAKLPGITWITGHPTYSTEGWYRWANNGQVTDRGDWELIEERELARGWYVWHHLRMELDFNRNRFAGLWVDGHELPLGLVPMVQYNGMPAQGPYMALSVLTWSGDQGAGELAIGGLSYES